MMIITVKMGADGLANQLFYLDPVSGNAMPCRRDGFSNYIRPAEKLQKGELVDLDTASGLLRRKKEAI